MKSFAEPGPENFFLAHHIKILRESLRHWTGRDLVDPGMSDREAAETLYNAPFVVVSHDTGPDPVFNYANRCAQKLFEMTWEEITRIVSRDSAERTEQEERDQLLQEVSNQGYIDNYKGVRIAKSGRRFRISNVIVWNLFDPDGNYYGQGATYSDWEILDEKTP